MIVGSSAVGRRVEQLTTDKVATVMEAKDHIAAAAQNFVQGTFVHTLPNFPIFSMGSGSAYVPKSALSCKGCGSHLFMVLWAHTSLPQSNSFSIGSSVSVGLTVVTDTQIHKSRYSVYCSDAA